MVEAPPQPFHIVRALAANAERITDVDRPVTSRQAKFVERLLVERGR